ncbi:MAG: T9SS type A sorting domain-containing protein [Chitinophagaceae bacterium]|nr:T9SS type A sorting domain-containing protein [Chitinophagaceae bacterium]
MKRTLHRLYGCILTATLILVFQNQLLSQCVPNAPAGGTTTIGTPVNTYFGGIAGTYGAGTGSPNQVLISCANVVGGGTLVVGDLVIVMQVQGAEFDADNDDTYGDGVSGGGNGYLNNANLLAGRYEYAVVTTITGTCPGVSRTLTLTGGGAGGNLLYTYSYSNFTQVPAVLHNRYQVILVPRYTNATINVGTTIDVADWNGEVGGVFAIDVTGTFTLNGTIDANGAGFRGGGFQTLTGAVGPVNTDYRTSQGTFLGAQNCNGAKGEGISGTPRWTYDGAAVNDNNAVSDEGYLNGSMGRGAPGNAGGGATDGNPALNDENAGGGGGGNGGTGGLGGRSFNSNLASTQGIGGASFTQAATNRVVFGGGGGAGSGDDAPTGHGGSGGGIVIITAATLVSATGIIQADGTDGTSATTGPADGAGSNGGGGGGAGGSIVFFIRTACSGVTATLSANGGNGGDAHGTVSFHGPGGGGGGGLIYTTCALTTSVTGGERGYTGDLTASETNAYGATNGSAGANANSYTAFQSIFQAPSSCLTLPVKISDFSLVYADSRTRLSWAGLNERNLRAYVIERSVDGNTFVAIGTVSAKNTSRADYSYVDPLVGVTSTSVYYRLKAVDIDGQFGYSSVLSARLGKLSKRFMIYPNPVNSRAQVLISLDKEERINLQLISASGQLLNSKVVLGSRGTNVISMDETQKLAEGVYIMKVIISKDVFTERLVIKR